MGILRRQTRIRAALAMQLEYYMVALVRPLTEDETGSVLKGKPLGKCLGLGAKLMRTG